MTRVNIYRVDDVVQAYAKESSRDFKKLKARHARIIKGKRFQKAFPNYNGLWDVNVEEGRGRGSYAVYAEGLIKLGGNRSEAVLLHEMAHHINHRHVEFGYGDDHDPGFASAYLALVKVVLGAEAERALRHAYKAIGVKVYKKGKPRGVPVRVRGEAPEKASELIDKMVRTKDGEKEQRAFLRGVVKNLPDETFWSNMEHAIIPCPEKGCDGEAKVEALVYYGGPPVRRRVQFELQHEACGLHESWEVSPKWYDGERRRVRQKAMDAQRAAHT